MRTCSVLCFIIIIVFQLVTLQTEAFTRVSVPTAFAIISAAAKFKIMWVKTYLGLRSMGYFKNHRSPQAVGGPPLHHFPRYPSYRRSMTSSSSSQLFIPHRHNHHHHQYPPMTDELLAAWKYLESVSGRQFVAFNVDSCLQGGTSPHQRLSLWRRLVDSNQISRLSNHEFSNVVSALIGSLTRDPRACRQLSQLTASKKKK